jgi:hypothetical protein
MVGYSSVEDYYSSVVIKAQYPINYSQIVVLGISALDGQLG